MKAVFHSVSIALAMLGVMALIVMIYGYTIHGPDETDMMGLFVISTVIALMFLGSITFALLSRLERRT